MKYLSPIDDNKDIATKEFAESQGGGATLPVGVVMPTATSTAPSGWFICDGSAVSRETYSALFSAIGTTYGTGDGSTTFNLPNLKGKIPVGYDESDTDFNSVGKTGGEKTHTITVNEMPSHSHTSTFYQAYTGTTGSTNNVEGAYTNYNYKKISLTTSATGGGAAHNNMPPFVTMNYIIYAGV